MPCLPIVSDRMKRSDVSPRLFVAGLLAGAMALILCGCSAATHSRGPAFRVLVVASSDHDHSPMIAKAEPFLTARDHFALDFTRDTGRINEANLAKYQVFIQLHLASFNMSPPQQKALQKFIEHGHGWIGVHAAGLTGKQFLAPGTPYWQWFQDLMGDIVYSPHPAIQTGSVVLEDRNHPVTRNLPASFEVRDEWYEFDKSPRPHVRVLARADESTYKPNKPMGDHPMIWINEKYRRALYIGIGHDAIVCADPNFTILMRDAILWSASPGRE
jgi:type 1 glutamine amidotransferase